MDTAAHTIHTLQDEITTLKHRNSALEHELAMAQERQDADELLHLFVDCLETYGMLLLDPEGHIISWNAGAQKLFGYRAEEVIGRHMSMLYLSEDIARQKPERVLRTAISAGKFEGENWRVRKDGSRFYANISVASLRDAAGELRGFSKVTWDVTLRRQQMEELEQQRAQLEDTIQIQQVILRELSTPLIPITDTVVVMPLIGHIDSNRAQLIMETLLDGIARTRANIAILDITGMPAIDTQIANALIQAAQAILLLGNRLILTGIRPEIAQTLVSLQIDLRGIVTFGTLQRGIAYALQQEATGWNSCSRVKQ